jgi:hypothetical protein
VHGFFASDERPAAAKLLCGFTCVYPSSGAATAVRVAVHMCVGFAVYCMQLFFFLSVLLANIMSKGSAGQQQLISHGQHGCYVVPCVLQA